MVMQHIQQIIGRFSGNEASEIAKEITELQQMYSDRARQFEEWQSLLEMEDILAQKDMESFVGNDPRTTWNMATFLLQPKPLISTVVSDNGGPLPLDILNMTDQVGRYFNQYWETYNQQNHSRGSADWFWGLIGLFTATGWYGLHHWVSLQNELKVNYLNPATLFPEYDDNEELVRLGIVRVITNDEATRKARREGWSLDNVPKQGNIIESQLWKHYHSEDTHEVYHGVVFGNKLMKSLQREDLRYIPITVGAVGATPRFISRRYTDNLVGESVLATNAKVFRNFNKLQTYMQQIIRDVSSPKIIHYSADNRVRIKPEDWNKRGAMFQLGINDKVMAVDMPALPVEMMQILFSLRNQIQRGGFSDLVFGNVLTEVTGVLLAQAAESAMQLMHPYYTGIITGLTAVTNCWYQTILEYGEVVPTGWPKDIDRRRLKNTQIQCHYSIHIPGDLASRIEMAKTLNPEFILPVQDTARLLLPEVGNPRDLLNKLDSELARKSPQYIAITLIQEFELAAQQAVADGNLPMRELLLTASSSLKATLGMGQTPEQRMGTEQQNQVSQQPNAAEIRMGTRQQQPRQRSQ